MSFQVPQQHIPKSADVSIPPGFLENSPSGPIKAVPISFSASAIPEYEGRVAVTIDNVLSSEECGQLISLAESSVQGPHAGSDSAWKPATVPVPPGVSAAPRSGYRESSRIQWHNQALVDRIWERCILADGLQQQLAVVPQKYGKVRTGEWQFRRANDCMRFLRYKPGQFFKPHCDGPYFYETDKTEFQTHYTLHLYLNDSRNNSSTGEGVVGGATAFLARDRKRRLDVEPRAGSVLIFQHEGLLHEGAEVKEGVKYTMRTDLLYEWVTGPPTRDQQPRDQADYVSG